MPAGFDAEVAELFRDLRLAANLDESELANRLDTQVEVVQALEQGTLYALPPWPETSRVVSAYGQLLNLDVQPLLRRVYAQVEAGVIPEEMPSDSPQPLDFSGSDPYDLGAETYEFEPSPAEAPTPQGASNGLYPDEELYPEPSPYGEESRTPPPPPRPQPQQNFGPGGAPQRPMPPQGAPRPQAPQGHPGGQPQGQRPPQGMPDPRGAGRPMGPGGQAPGQFPGQRPQQPPRPGGPPPQYRPPPPGGPQGMPPGAQQGRPPQGGQFRPQPGGGPMPPQPGPAAPPPSPQDAVWPEAEFAPPPEAQMPGQGEKKAGRLKKAIAMIVIVLAAIFVLWLLFSQVGSLFGTGGAPQEEIGQSAEPPSGDAAPEEPLDPNDPQNRKSDRLPLPEMPQ